MVNPSISGSQTRHTSQCRDSSSIRWRFATKSWSIYNKCTLIMYDKKEKENDKKIITTINIAKKA